MNPTKQEKLKILLGKLNDLESRSVLPDDGIDSMIKEEVSNLSSKLAENPTIKILKKFSSELTSFKKDFDLQPIREAIEGFQSEIEENNKSTAESYKQELTSKIEEIRKAIPTIPEIPDEFDASDLEADIAKLRVEFLSKQDFDPTSLKADLDSIREQFQALTSNIADDSKTSEESKSGLEKKIEDLKKELIGLIANIPRNGGGNMNRQIFVGGTNPLTKYTDINFKAGSNVTLTTANNNTTRKVDITISATGGGGGSGITRSINNVSTATAAGSTSSVDYVYLCSGTMTLTLPDATAGNLNLYTVKNVGSGVITINTTSSQTIDGNLIITMPVQYTSIDVESDTANWVIT